MEHAIGSASASTEETEDNCAAMAVKDDYLNNGNIKNSVNYPDCDMGVCASVNRVALPHMNIPKYDRPDFAIRPPMDIANMTNTIKKYALHPIDLENELMT